jgi:hypothetical protein
VTSDWAELSGSTSPAASRFAFSAIANERRSVCYSVFERSGDSGSREENASKHESRADRPWPSGSLSACDPQLSACCGPPRPASGATRPLSSVVAAWSMISIVPWDSIWGAPARIKAPIWSHMARRMPVPETRKKQTLQLPFPDAPADNVFRYFRPIVSVSQHALQPRVNRSAGCHHQAGERTKGFHQFLYPARPRRTESG